MAGGFAQEVIQAQRKDKELEKNNALQLKNTPPSDQAQGKGDLMPETIAAIALALQLKNTPPSDQAQEKGDLMPETIAAIALALHMHFFSERTGPWHMAEKVSNAWTLSGRTMVMADRLRVFNR
jgi:hypothetical protein